MRKMRLMAEVGGQYSFLVNGAQHVALNITVTAADMYMQTALKSLEKSINNGTFVDRLNAAGAGWRYSCPARMACLHEVSAPGKCRNSSHHMQSRQDGLLV
jgi:hypothetical protein